MMVLQVSEQVAEEIIEELAILYGYDQACSTTTSARCDQLHSVGVYSQVTAPPTTRHRV